MLHQDCPLCALGKVAAMSGDQNGQLVFTCENADSRIILQQISDNVDTILGLNAGCALLFFKKAGNCDASLSFINVNLSGNTGLFDGCG